MTLHHIEVVSLKSNLSVASVVSAKSFETGSSCEFCQSLSLLKSGGKTYACAARILTEHTQYCSAQILLVEHMGYEYTGGS
jgi:hypothetical protein